VDGSASGQGGKSRSAVSNGWQLGASGTSGHFSGRATYQPDAEPARSNVPGMTDSVLQVNGLYAEDVRLAPSWAAESRSEWKGRKKVRADAIGCMLLGA